MQSLKFLVRYAKSYTGVLVVTVVAMLLLVGAQLVIPWIIKTMVATVTDPTGIRMSYESVTRLTLLALAVYLVRAGLQFLRSYMAHIAGWGVVADARVLIYEHLQKLTLRFYSNKQTGQLMSRVVNDSDKFELLIAHAVPDLVVNALTLIGVTAVLVSINWKLALLTMIPIPLILFGMRGFAKFVQPAFIKRQQELGELNAILADNLAGMREIKAFTREEHEASRIRLRIDNYKNSLLYALKMLAIFHPFIQLSSALGTIVIIYFGGRMIVGETLAIDELVAFFLYLDLFYQPLQRLSDSWEQIQESLASAVRVNELLDENPEPDEGEDAIVLPGRARGDLRFEDVAFNYLDGEPVLEGITLNIPSGSTLALVGPTGVGKTTLASLVPRFYDVSSGRITLDGHDLRSLSLASLRQQISMVLQDVYLFHGTARENILFGRGNATEEEMIEAAKIANAHEFLERLPDGYDTIIGERGVKLSGGQKQRLSIARAILKDAPILILDEATSAVDTETEALIQQALERLMQGRTTIVIAHRLSTVRNADQIVVLSEGGIAEQGTHAELMRLQGIYWKLNQVQQRAAMDEYEPVMAQMAAPVTGD
ncbi:MAG: ABC transporter ATP-binding protein [Caldilineaceae bacterium]|nr:ABC transporter ATP-binding protein [Caldilineaceae bacterium]